MKDNKAEKIRTNKPTKAKKNYCVGEKNNKTAETFTKFKTLMICYQLPTPNNKQITCTQVEFNIIKFYGTKTPGIS